MRSFITASGRSANWLAGVRQMTADQLSGLGTHHFVYLRTGTYDGERIFVLHGADGRPLVTVDDVETAEEIATERGLEFVAVH